jgi:hypothetical protein
MFVNVPAPIDDSKFFEAAQTLAQGLSQWDLLILAGSLVIVVSTSYYRPRDRRVRAAYFLFLPTWFCLALSVYQGINVQRSYVAYLVSTRATPQASLLNAIAESMTSATRKQILSLEIALLFTGAWLIIYIVWWVFSNQPQGNS